MSVQLPGIEKFKPHGGEPSSVAQRWERWTKAFEYFLIASGITNDARKKAMLLHLAGRETQDIFEALTPDGNTYTNALDALNDHFRVKKNVTFERSKFLHAKQDTNESTEQFITRLRKLATNCEYTDTADQIRDRVVVAGNSNKLRKRLLAENNLTLEKCIEISRTLESATEQSRQIENVQSNGDAEFSNYVKKGDRRHHYRNLPKHQQQKSPNKSCNRCGATGHTGSECRRSKGKTCSFCGKIGHFQIVCMSKKRSEIPPNVSNRRPSTNHNQHNATRTPRNHSHNRHNTNRIDQPQADDIIDDETHHSNQTSMMEPETYIFHISKPGKIPLYQLKVNNTEINILIDSGSSLNLLDYQTYQFLSPKPELSPSNVKIFGYNASQPLPVCRTFEATVSTEETNTDTRFYVIPGKSGSLLSKSTAEELNILRVGPPSSVVNSTTVHDQDIPLSTKSIIDHHANVFQGTGILKNFELQLHIDPTITPVQQPIRRVPYHTRRKVETELERLLNLDIIEPVAGPTSWLNPFVPVPKSDGSIRICLDMRKANTAILRERHVIPKMEDIIQDLHGAKVFSKIDLREGYHQIKLHENSRDITTFATHKGVFRYKRLIFGVNSAFESFQKQVEQVLSDCSGARNISDDVLIWGSTIEEHNNHLKTVLTKFHNAGLKINPRKCQFAKETLTFAGHQISSNGISVDIAKIKAIQVAGRPTNLSELRSFLGMITYSHQYIQNFSSIAAPLRKLTKKDIPYTWGDDQEHAFTTLKTKIAEAPVMSFYHPDAITRLTVDARATRW